MDVADRYKLLEKIGSGSFATVYRAQDLELGREVAVKQIHSQFLADSAQTERYWREATLLASFQHPHIVTIYDVVRSRGWLILELMQANLRDRLQGKPMDLKAVQTTLTQALRALGSLHGRGIVHGDIKPSNLMIDHRKRIKLGDFGLARRVSHDEGSVIRGTAKYMAPETLSQDYGDVGPQSDLYSLGFTAYELMCGTKFETLFPGLDAFGRDRQAAWMMWHAAADRTLPDVSRAMTNVPAPLARVINGLIEKNPKKRYATAEAALADLGATRDEPTGSTDSKTKPSAVEKPAAASKRHLAVGAFAVSMAASAAMLFWPAGQTTTTTQSLLKPVLGVVRTIDAATGAIEYEDPVTGQPDELKMPEKPRIRLIGEGGRDEFILPKKIQPGDWIRLEPGSDLWQLDVARPRVSQGMITAVDAAAERLTVSIQQQRVRDSVTMQVPARAEIDLNGRPVQLRDLSADDQLTVEHVLDPAGKLGQVASRIKALRAEDISGIVTAADAAARTLTIDAGAKSAASRSWPVAEDAVMTLDDGAPATWDDVRLGRRVKLAADAAIRRIVVFSDESVEGRLSAVDVAARTISLKGEGQATNYAVAPDAEIRINQLKGELDDLRPEDTLRLSLKTGADSVPQATAIDAVRAARYDRCVILIANGTSRDRSLPPLPHAAEDARLLHETAVSLYATPSDWAVLLIDRSRDEVLNELKTKLSGLRPGTQAIVFIEGYGLVDEGRPLVACADFKINEALTTGLPLAEIVSMLEQSPSQQKMLLLDLSHETPGFDDPRFVGPNELLNALPEHPSGTAVICADPMPTASDGGRKTGDFAEAIAKALAGRADKDRDFTTTSDELVDFLKAGQSPAFQWRH